MVAARRPREIVGAEHPRIGPPLPLRSKLAAYEAAAAKLGMNLYPWQRVAASYITALNDAGHWVYREVAVVVARQNGKTQLMVPRILMGLELGESILHTAQNRDIPRKTFIREVLPAMYRAGIEFDVRKSNGQEEISTPTGGRYKIVAPNDSSRGETADLVLIDEVWHQQDQELMDAMLFTTAARPNAQIIYLSNAGDMGSVVLNELRDRGSKGIDPRLAYLEWSSDPNRPIDDRDGWAEANPAMGHGYVTEETIEGFLHSRPQTSFERETLCRPTMSRIDSLVAVEDWQGQQFTVGLQPKRPVMGIKMDINGERVSAVLAWPEADDRIGLDVVLDVTGHEMRTEEVVANLREIVLRKHVKLTVYDPFTDADLARNLRRTKPLTGRDYGSATKKFVTLTHGHQLRVHDENGILASDLIVTVPRKMSGGAYIAVKAAPEVTNTAAEAAIRAVWYASEPQATGKARIY